MYVQDLAKELLRTQINKSAFNVELNLSGQKQISDLNDKESLKEVIKDQKENLKKYIQIMEETQQIIQNMISYVMTKGNQITNLVKVDLESQLEKMFQEVNSNTLKENKDNDYNEEDRFSVTQIIKKIQEELLDRNERLSQVYVENTHKKRYKTTHQLFQITNKIQKLYSILSNRNIIQSYIELDKQSLLEDLLQSNQIQPITNYLKLNNTKITSQLNGTVNSNPDRRLCVVRLQGILRQSTNTTNNNNINHKGFYRSLALQRFNQDKYEMYKQLNMSDIQSELAIKELDALEKHSIDLQKEYVNLKNKGILNINNDNTYQDLLEVITNQRDILALKEKQKQILYKIKTIKDEMQYEYSRLGNQIMTDMIEKEREKTTDDLERVVEESMNQIDSLINEEEEYEDTGDSLSERVRSELDKYQNTGLFAQSSPIAKHINNTIYRKDEGKYKQDIEKQKEQREERERQDRTKRERDREERERQKEERDRIIEQQREERQERERRGKEEREERERERRDKQREDRERERERKEKGDQERNERQEEQRLIREREKVERDRQREEEDTKRNILRKEKEEMDREERKKNDQMREERDRQQRILMQEQKEKDQQQKEKQMKEKNQREEKMKEEKDKLRIEREQKDREEKEKKGEKDQEDKRRKEQEREEREERQSKMKAEQEEQERKRKEKEDQMKQEKERQIKEDKEKRERERKQREEDDKRIKEDQDKKRKEREEEDRKRKDKEREEKEKKQKQDDEKKKLQKEKDERDRKQKEEEDKLRKQKEKEEKERKQKEEDERKRIQKEKDEGDRKQREEQEKIRKQREKEEKEKKQKEDDDKKKAQREKEEKDRKQKEEDKEKERLKKQKDEEDRKQKEKEEKDRKQREKEEKEKKQKEEDDKKKAQKEKEEKERKKEEEEEKQRKQKEKEEQERERKLKEQEEKQRNSSGKKQSEEDYEEDFEFEEIEDIEEDLDFGLNTNKPKHQKQESKDNFEDLDNMIDELDTINNNTKKIGEPINKQQDSYAFDLEDEELDIEEEPQEIYEDDFYQGQQEEEEEEDEDQIMPDYIISEQNIGLNNNYIKQTRYYQKDQQYSLEEFNNLDALYFIFEEQVHQKKAFFLDFDHTNAFIELQERFMNECQQSSAEQALESIEEDLMTLDQGIKESYYQQMKELEFVETCRIFLPFAPDNKFKLLLMELNPYSSCNLLYFHQTGEDLDEQQMEELESFMMVVSQIFGNENYQNMNVELKEQQWAVLNTHMEREYEPILLLLFCTLYDQDLPNFLQDYDVRLTDQTQERLFCVGQGFKEAFQLLEESFDQIEDYYQSVIEQAQQQEDLQIVMSNYPAGMDFEDLLTTVKQDLNELFSQDYQDDHQTLVCISLRFEQEEEEVVNYYIHLVKQDGILKVSLFFFDAFQNINQYILQIVNSFKQAQLAFQFFYDFARHNIVYEQSTLTIGTVLKLMGTGQYTVHQAMTLVSYSLIPFIIEFENQ